ncbi:hypothetical protein A8W25_01455 [Streptomyces sp. ERV7]|uniref:hypothetical protein n=1 Tax=Streptomyces sp. ERV7 TaxID=1322334 RepID=UPI0007F4D56F|nr:hypothetical protein [Streptomyces sp. ERV7]OAR26980.1 hypothetical protein A8W25_01455 [Streptomyces sp. ERV7]
MGRYAVGALGVALMGLGVSLVWAQSPWDVAVWLVGAVVLHDGLIAPLVLLVGLGVAATRPWARGPLRAALMTGGCLTAIALPDILRPGPVTNATVLPLDYLRNWLVLLAAVAVAGALVAAAKRVREERGRRRKTPEGGR